MIYKCAITFCNVSRILIYVYLPLSIFEEFVVTVKTPLSDSCISPTEMLAFRSTLDFRCNIPEPQIDVTDRSVAPLYVETVVYRFRTLSTDRSIIKQ